ncbi:translation initiation factor eIF2B [Purpureocillium lilacinum]|uniref:Translation initiation factor eIF2B n=1 Tax=Purpureocillium lilacinum TaxID=33203 RepID=A0A179HG27_PURLI|nr:translation initiation factor eIF2B [Purpureocillium lilacinum]OAQ88912.1 translation initiation factor eIF2B [Purpureocillium lilacinum]
MPRRNRRQQHDFDFDIHVDPSCMSEPTTYDDTMEQEVPKVEDHEVGAGEDALRYDEEALETRNALDADQELDMDQTDEAKAVLEEQPEEQEAFATEDERHEETLADKAAEELEAALEELVDGVAQQPVQEATEESTQAPDEDDAHSDAHDLSIVASEVSQSAHDVSDVHSEAPVSTADDQTDDTVTVNHAEHDAASVTDHDQSILGSEADTRDSVSRRESAMSSASHDSDRRASYRTEALIHAAARDIVQQLGRRESAPAADTADSSYVAGSEPTSARQSYGGESTVEHHDKDDDHNEEDVEEAEEAPEAGDSSSHHEHEDDVFSDDSPRSSMGSMSEAEQTKIEQTLSLRNITQRSHSPRISDIPPSDMDDQDFVATVRGTPRPPFRSPSSVRAMQMSSPPASVFGQTPRSNRRTPLPTVSRLGSPSVSAQYSPKKTPPRFKRATPPLVLLHVTLLPLRWAWADVLEAADAGDLSPEAKTLRDSWRQLQERTGDTVSDRGILLPHPQNDYEVLEERLLEALELPLRRRARILECGHYLGPANEMTLPEEMDSDCGDEYDEYRQSFGTNSRRSTREGADKTHWCRTCKSEIRYDSLGQGRVFRVKVYASNGLMRAGAWEACWKEMERVDVELEPIVDAALSDELAELAAEQERAMEMRVAVAVEDDQHQEQQPEYEDTFVENQAEELVRDPEPTHPDEEEHRHVNDEDDDGHGSEEQQRPCTPAPEPRMPPAPLYQHEERRRTVDEERLREIYGSTPPAHAEAPSSRRAKGESAYTTRETPPSPSVGAHARREHARQREAYQGGAATLPELLLEAVRVAMRDRKNVVIGLLSVLILLLAARAGERAPPPAATFQTVVTAPDAPLAKVEGQMAVESVSGLTLSEEDIVAAASVTASAMTEGESAAAYTTTAEQASQASDPCSLSVGDASTSIVRVVETVTETIRETVLETATVASPAPVATQETVASADPVATQEAELLLQQKMELPRSNDTTEVTPEEKSEEAVALLSDDDDAAAA